MAIGHSAAHPGLIVKAGFEHAPGITRTSRELLVRRRDVRVRAGRNLSAPASSPVRGGTMVGSKTELRQELGRELASRTSGDSVALPVTNGDRAPRCCAVGEFLASRRRNVDLHSCGLRVAARITSFRVSMIVSPGTIRDAPSRATSRTSSPSAAVRSWPSTSTWTQPRSPKRIVRVEHNFGRRATYGGSASNLPVAYHPESRWRLRARCP